MSEEKYADKCDVCGEYDEEVRVVCRNCEAEFSDAVNKLKTILNPKQ